jgi:hypothetical protein
MESVDVRTVQSHRFQCCCLLCGLRCLTCWGSLVQQSSSFNPAEVPSTGLSADHQSTCGQLHHIYVGRYLECCFCLISTASGHRGFTGRNMSTRDRAPPPKSIASPEVHFSDLIFYLPSPILPPSTQRAPDALFSCSSLMCFVMHSSFLRHFP